MCGGEGGGCLQYKNDSNLIKEHDGFFVTEISTRLFLLADRSTE